MADSEVLERRRVYPGRIVSLDVERVRLPNGVLCELELVRHPGAAAVVPLDSAGEVTLVRQFRHATGEWLHEVPAGTLDSPDEPPERCALRELAEEAGLSAKTLEPLGWIWTTPGFTDEKIWLYLARDLAPARQALDRDELLSVERVSLARAIEMAATGAIRDAKSVCALLRAAHRLGGR